MENYLSGQRMTGNTCRTATSPAFRPASITKPILDWDWRFGLKEQAEGSNFAFARAGSTCVNLPGGIVAQVGSNVPRYSADGLVLEGGATNKCTCAKSNPQDLTNITKSGDAAAVLSVVNDAAELVKVGLSAFGPNVYKIDNSAGTEQAFATPVGIAGNTNVHSLAVFARALAGTMRLYWSAQAGSAASVLASTSSSTYSRVTAESKTPTITNTNLTVAAMPGSVVYFTLPQLEEGPVCTSPIPGGTGAITRASEGADTSGNGLSIPLSQGMIDSLKGERIDWSTAWTYSADPSYYSISGKTITCASSDGSTRLADKVGALLAGQAYEVSYTVSDLTGGSMRVYFGSSSNAATTNLPAILANGTYVAREVATNGTTFGVRFNGSATGSVTINYCRRVLDSGQTNPGEGTVLCGVYLPWASSAAPASQLIPVCGTNNSTSGLLYGLMSGTTWRFPAIFDGISSVFVNSTGLISGYYVIISQYSAALGKMRVGIYNPATGALTWGSYATYRGFFPIYGTGDQQRLRFFYGGGAFPIYALSTKWFNTILADTELIYHANRGL